MTSVVILGMGNCQRRQGQSQHDDEMIERFPMWVASVRDLRRFALPLEAHESHREQRAITMVQDGFVVIFVSHQWVGPSHPDPLCRQFGVLQSALDSLASGKLAAQADGISVCAGLKPIIPTKKQTRAIYDWYVWFDYISIPQDPGHRDQLREAVQSIPSYVERSTYFMILAPPVLHQGTGLYCTYRTWQRRGWCRAELISCMLSTTRKTPLLLTSCSSLLTISVSDWLCSCPGQGDFTEESDKPLVGTIVHELMMKKTKVFLEQGKVTQASILNAIRSHMLGSLLSKERIDEVQFTATSSIARSASKTSSGGSFRVVTSRSSESITLRSRLSPLMLAAIANNGREVRRLLEVKADASTRLTAGMGDPAFMLLKGSTAMSLACQFGSAEAVGSLLDHRADAAHRGAIMGLGPLEAASMFGHAAVVELLLQRHADACQLAAGANASVLHLTALGGHIEPAKLLLAARADITHHDFIGNTAMQACMNSEIDYINLLLEHRASVNATYQAYGHGRLLRDLFRFALRRGFVNPMTLGVAVAGEAPLFGCIFHSDVSVVEHLLKQRADVGQKLYNGKTAVEFAKLCGHEEKVQLLERYNPTTREFSSGHVACRSPEPDANYLSGMAESIEQAEADAFDV